MEQRLHPRLQIRARDRLSDPVRDRRHPEHPQAAVLLRYLHHAHRRREVAPRREPIPELEQVPVKVLLELLDRLLVNAGRALVRLDPQPGLPNSPLGDHKRLRLRLAHPAPPTRRRLTAKLTRTTPPLRSRPITGRSSLLREGPPLRPASLLSPSRFPPLEALAPDDQPQATTTPLASRPIGATGSPVPHESPDHARATIHAGHPPGQSAGSRQARPGATTGPRFRMSPLRFRHVNGGSLPLVFVIHT